MNEIMKHKFGLALVLAAASVSMPAMAGEGAGGFVRVEAGSNKLDVDTNIEVSGSDRDTGFGVRGGYFFNPSFAIEGFYSNYGEATGGDWFYVGSVRYDFRTTAKVTALGVGVVGKTNFGGDNTGFYLSGRTGIARAKTDASLSLSGSDGYRDGDSMSDTATKPYFGVGLGYDFSPNFGMSASYDWVKAELSKNDIDVNSDVQSLALGAEFRF